MPVGAITTSVATFPGGSQGRQAAVREVNAERSQVDRSQDRLRVQEQAIERAEVELAQQKADIQRAERNLTQQSRELSQRSAQLNRIQAKPVVGDSSDDILGNFSSIPKLGQINIEPSPDFVSNLGQFVDTQA